MAVFPIGYWLPRVDVERESPFLPAEPEKMIREKRFNSVPFITGIASHEGLGWQKRDNTENHLNITTLRNGNTLHNSLNLFL